MRVVLHPKISSDVQAIMDYYRNVAGPELAEEFRRELRQLFVRAATRPTSFAVREGGFRRANLLRFPYHFLFSVKGETVRILVVRHHRRRASLGVLRR